MFRAWHCAMAWAGGRRRAGIEEDVGDRADDPGRRVPHDPLAVEPGVAQPVGDRRERGGTVAVEHPVGHRQAGVGGERRRLPDDPAAHVGHVVRLGAQRGVGVVGVRGADQVVDVRQHHRAVGRVDVGEREVEGVEQVGLLHVGQGLAQRREVRPVGQPEEGHLGGRQGIARLVVVVHRQPDLLEIVDALRAARRLRADCTAGKSSAIRTEMMAMTTKSSIRVKPGRERRGIMVLDPCDRCYRG